MFYEYRTRNFFVTSQQSHEPKSADFSNLYQVVYISTVSWKFTDFFLKKVSAPKPSISRTKPNWTLLILILLCQLLILILVVNFKTGTFLAVVPYSVQSSAGTGSWDCFRIFSRFSKHVIFKRITGMLTHWFHNLCTFKALCTQLYLLRSACLNNRWQAVYPIFEGCKRTYTGPVECLGLIKSRSLGQWPREMRLADGECSLGCQLLRSPTCPLDLRELARDKKITGTIINSSISKYGCKVPAGIYKIYLGRTRT